MPDRRHPRKGEDFERFFRAQLPGLVSLCRRVTGSQASAEDVAAEALARCYASWPRVGVMDNSAGWVTRVALNLIIDGHRRQARAPRVRLGPPAPVDDPAEVVGSTQGLVTLLGALPRRQREAVALRYLADLSEQQVATAMGLSVGTVKSHLHKAMAKLRTTHGIEGLEVGNLGA